MNDDIESLLDDLCHCQAEIENGLLALRAKYIGEREETVLALVRAWDEVRQGGLDD